jgi:hypothetical protein
MLALPPSRYRTTQYVRKHLTTIYKKKEAGKAFTQKSVDDTADTGVENMPVELMEMVCKDPDLSEFDWYRLCFAKPFHNVAMALLYTKVNCFSKNMASLARTLVEYPHLAALVRPLDVEEGRVQDVPEEDVQLYYDHSQKAD